MTKDDARDSPAQPLLQKAAADRVSQEFCHPFNEKSQVFLTPISRMTGMVRCGVSIARIPPGKESFAYHSHYREEEWIYILSGVGIAEIDGEETEVSAGDFMGFPTPSVAHSLRNSGSEDLVYLMGGESLDFEVADFPHHGKRMLRLGGGEQMNIEIYDIDAAQPFDLRPAGQGEAADG